MAGAGAGAARRGGLKRPHDADAAASDAARTDESAAAATALPVQLVVLGLCRRCWALANAYNDAAGEASRRKLFSSPA